MSEYFSVDESTTKIKGRKNKKAEAAALAAAERIKKYGICCIPIKIANYFSAGKQILLYRYSRETITYTDQSLKVNQANLYKKSVVCPL